MNERYVIVDSSKWIGKYSVLDTKTGREFPCHNYATAKSSCKELNENNSNFCNVCECDPCDCHGSEETEDMPNDPLTSFWKIWGDK